MPVDVKPDKGDRPQAFDLFSPIPVEEKQSKVTDNMKNQPRVLSLDSGNFSVTSKQAESQNLMTVSGDALKPVVVHATSDSISTVSMNDISHWHNGEFVIFLNCVVCCNKVLCVYVNDDDILS